MLQSWNREARSWTAVILIFENANKRPILGHRSSQNAREITFPPKMDASTVNFINLQLNSCVPTNVWKHLHLTILALFSTTECTWALFSLVTIQNGRPPPSCHSLAISERTCIVNIVITTNWAWSVATSQPAWMEATLFVSCNNCLRMRVWGYWNTSHKQEILYLYRPTVSSSQTIFAKSIGDNGGPFAEGTPLIGKANRPDAYLYLSCAV